MVHSHVSAMLGHSSSSRHDTAVFEVSSVGGAVCASTDCCRHRASSTYRQVQRIVSGSQCAQSSIVRQSGAASRRARVHVSSVCCRRVHVSSVCCRVVAAVGVSSSAVRLPVLRASSSVVAVPRGVSSVLVPSVDSCCLSCECASPWRRERDAAEKMRR